MAKRNSVLLAKARPELRIQWDAEKNPPLFDILKQYDNRRFWWKCPNGHSWQVAVSKRSAGSGCPYCAGKQVTTENCLATKFPAIAAEWHEKNEIAPSQVIARSGHKFWWKCTNGHEWQTTPNERVRGSGCPFCSGNKLTDEKTLANVAPHLIGQWNYDKNELTPFSIAANSNRKVWWKCEKGHEWVTTPNNRVRRGDKCNACLGRVSSPDSNLSITHPALTVEWDSEKNGRGPESTTRGSNTKVWWKCAEGHSWRAAPCDRTKGRPTGCPSCAVTHTNLEKAFEALMGIDRYNRPPIEGFGYKPDFKLRDGLFVDVDGLYWHCEINRDRKYHRQKYLAFRKYGWRLMQFYQDEVDSKPEIVKSMVNVVAGTVSRKIAARSCNLIQIQTHKANEFLERNHLLGSPKIGSKYVGLIHNDELVMLIGYRFNRADSKMEITRVCTVINTIAVGGFSKLLNFLEKHHFPASITTIVDVRYADGHSLERCGWVKEKEYLQYEYTNFTHRLDKRQFRVKAGVNEAKAAAEQGYYRIWGPGRERWTKTLATR